MKFRKITALLTSLIFSAASFNGISCFAANGIKCECEGMTLYMERSEMSWFMDDSSMQTVYEAVISSDSEMIAIPSRIGARVPTELNCVISENTKYLALPQELIKIGYDAFTGCSKLEAVLIPDKVDDIQSLDSELAVVGNEKTYAEFFANKNGNEFIRIGDINNDGQMNIADLIGNIKYLIGQNDFENGISRLAADINGDGNISVLDVLLMKQKLLDDDTVEIESMAAPVFNTTRTAPAPEIQSGFFDFAAEYSDNILSAPDENEGINKVYSPLSIYMAFSVLAECCDGQSLDELLGFLKVSDKEELRKSNHDLFDSLYFDEFKRYNRMSNSIWIDDRFICENETLKNLADYYYTTSFIRDLSSSTDCDEISQWIYQNTSGKFKPEIEPSADSVLKIINTVTFREKWQEIFESTKEDVFYSGDDKINCTFLTGTMTGRINETERYVKYSKDFQDGFVMNFVLPTGDEDVDSILSDSEIMNDIFSSTEGMSCLVKTSIPKFSSTSKFNLIPVAESLGLERIFKRVDIEPLINSEKNVLLEPFVNEITHEAVIDVDENGCEAAAYTLISIKDECIPTPHYAFCADKPFIYYVSDTNGTPLFIGTVYNPLEK